MAHEAARPQRETTPEEWEHLREILANALEVNPIERSGYLDTACRNDSYLRARVEELIAAHLATDAASLDAPAFLITSSSLSNDQLHASVIGRRIGAYRIEAEIARGGMGAVYRAVRADDEYRKQVAIKLVGGAAFSSHAAEMFRRERQVLAGLEHPNIARLLDGGTTEEGSPYLVMEYIEGEPVTTYVESRQLGVRDRLLLFQKICSAVQYAHQHLVIHRDIKPGNILVTREGEPKLLDFGIAKLIDLNATVNVTATAWQAFTPAYASPEQLLGEAITTATDVYSLGLVLYELLTGANPFVALQSWPLRLQRAILEEDPEPPSSAALRSAIPHREQLSREVQGDLDSIAGKAIRKDRAERYVSVEQFSDDIRRHFENLPVLAQPDSYRYRAAKFTRRHKTGILAAVFILVSLLTGMMLTAREARIARAERLRAERRFNDVRKLANSLLFEIHDSIQDLPGSTPARKLIAQKSLEYLDSLSSESINDPTLLRELATAYERVGELQGHYLADNLGETSNSLISYNKALGIRKRLGEAPNAEWQDQLSLAESYRRMGSQADAMNDRPTALADLQLATKLSERVEKIRPHDFKVLNELAYDYQVLGTLQEDFNAQLDADRKVVEIADQMVKLQPDDLEAQRRLGMAALQVANTQSDADHFPEAADSFARALDIYRSIAQRSSTVRDRRRIAVIFNQTGMLNERQGNLRTMLDDDQQALKIYRQLVAEDGKNALLRQGLAITLANNAQAHDKLGLTGEGRTEVQQAIAIMNTLMADPNQQQRDVLAQMHMIFADNFVRDHQSYPALREYRAALQIYQSMPVNMNKTAVATCKVGIAQSETLLGKEETATDDFNDVIALTKSAVAMGYRAYLNRDDIRAAALAYAGLGDVQTSRARRAQGANKQSHWEQAIAYYRQSLAIGNQLPPFAQLDGSDFRAVEVTKKLHQAELGARAAGR